MPSTILFGGLALYALCYVGLLHKAHKDSLRGVSEKKTIKLVEQKELKSLTVGTSKSYPLVVPTYRKGKELKIGKELKGEEIESCLLIVLDNARGKIKFDRSDIVYNDLQFVLDFMKALSRKSLEDFVNLSAFNESVAIVTIRNSINKGIFTQDNDMLIHLLIEVSEQLKESRLRYIERHSSDMGDELLILKQSKDSNHKVFQF